MAGERDVLAAVVATTVDRSPDGSGLWQVAPGQGQAFVAAIAAARAILGTQSTSPSVLGVAGLASLDKTRLKAELDGRLAAALSKSAPDRPEPLPREALDVERLARALQLIHGAIVPLPNRATPAEYAAIIARWYADSDALGLSPDRPTPP